MIDSPTQLQRMLRDFVRNVEALTAGRRTRLARLTVALPPDISAAGFISEAKERLHRAGLEQIEWRSVEGVGPPRIVAAEFER